LDRRKFFQTLEQEMALSRIQAVEEFSEVIPARVQEKLSGMSNAPILDEWVSEHLSEEHNVMYKALMQLRYASREEFPIRLEDLAESLGYTRLENAREKLLADFDDGSDFVLCHPGVKKSGRGRPALEYVLTLKCAQKFAVNCHTEQGKKVAAFFVEVVEVLQDYHKLTLLRDERRKGLKLRHDVLIQQHPRVAGFSACYIAIVGILGNFYLVKLGRSDNIGQRMKKLKVTFGECFLYDVIVVRNGLDLENKLKADTFLQRHHLEKEDLPAELSLQTELYHAADFSQVDKFGTAIRSLTKELTTAQEAEWIHNERMRELEIEAIKARRKYLKTLKDLGVPGGDVKEILLAREGASVETRTTSSSSPSTSLDEVPAVLGNLIPPAGREGVLLQTPSAEEDDGGTEDEDGVGEQPLQEVRRPRNTHPEVVAIAREFVKKRVEQTQSLSDRLSQNDLTAAFGVWCNREFPGKVSVKPRVMTTYLKREMEAAGRKQKNFKKKPSNRNYWGYEMAILSHEA